MDDLIIDLIKKNLIKIDLNNKDNPISFNFKNLIAYQYLINSISKMIYNKLRLIEYEHIIGVSNTGIHISSILSYNYNINLLMYSNHTLKQIYGVYEDNTSCVIIGDIIYTGNTLKKYTNILNKHLLKVNNIIFLCNNLQNNPLKIQDCNIHSLFDIYYIINILKKKQMINNPTILDIYNIDKREFLNYRQKFINNTIGQKLISICKTKKTRICFSCNMYDIKEIINMITIVGKYICLLSINSYLIDNFTLKYGVALQKLANNYNFILLNDIGISDIKYIKPSITTWCDLVTINCNTVINTNNTTNTNMFKTLNFIVNGNGSNGNGSNGNGSNGNGSNGTILNDKNNNIVGYKNNFVNNNSFLRITDTINNIENFNISTHSNYDIIALGTCIINKSPSDIHIILNHINNLLF